MLVDYEVFFHACGFVQIDIELAWRLKKLLEAMKVCKDDNDTLNDLVTLANNLTKDKKMDFKLFHINESFNPSGVEVNYGDNQYNVDIYFAKQ